MRNRSTTSTSFSHQMELLFPMKCWICDAFNIYEMSTFHVSKRKNVKGIGQFGLQHHGDWKNYNNFDHFNYIKHNLLSYFICTFTIFQKKMLTCSCHKRYFSVKILIFAYFALLFIPFSPLSTKFSNANILDSTCIILVRTSSWFIPALPWILNGSTMIIFCFFIPVFFFMKCFSKEFSILFNRNVVPPRKENPINNPRVPPIEATIPTKSWTKNSSSTFIVGFQNLYEIVTLRFASGFSKSSWKNVSVS